MHYSGDPIADFNRYDQAQADYEAKLPKCYGCGKPIQDDYLYDIDGEILCEDCVKYMFRKNAEDYMS